MDFKDLIISRQSVRKYVDKLVEEEKILQCVEAARLSPSACNAQPWTLVVVNNADILKKITETIKEESINSWAEKAPIFIVFVLEMEPLMPGVKMSIGDMEYRLMDIGMAAEHFCLMATELELGTCVLGCFNEQKLKEILNIPKSKRIPLIITLGYTDSKQRNKRRKEFETMCKFNNYE